MNLLLFDTLQGDTHPIGEKDPADVHEVPAGSGKVGQLKRRIYETYRNLVSKLDYHERLCSKLRNHPDLWVFHSPGVDPNEARRKLRNFMKSCIRKHTVWAWIDGVIAVLGIILAPLPGPNIFFFYPAARSLGHYFARAGARNVLGRENLHFQIEPLIDEVQIHLKKNPEGAHEAISKLEQRYNLGDLEKLLKPLKEHERE